MIAPKVAGSDEEPENEWMPMEREREAELYDQNLEVRAKSCLKHWQRSFKREKGAKA